MKRFYLIFFHWSFNYFIKLFINLILERRILLLKELGPCQPSILQLSKRHKNIIFYFLDFIFFSLSDLLHFLERIFIFIGIDFRVNGHASNAEGVKDFNRKNLIVAENPLLNFLNKHPKISEMKLSNGHRLGIAKQDPESLKDRLICKPSTSFNIELLLHILLQESRIIWRDVCWCYPFTIWKKSIHICRNLINPSTFRFWHWGLGYWWGFCFSCCLHQRFVLIYILWNHIQMVCYFPDSLDLTRSSKSRVNVS